MVKRGNEYYTLEADVKKNRLYFTCMGKVPSVGAIPKMESDMKVAAKELKPGWGILGNFLDVGEPFPQDVQDLHTKLQQWTMKNGCTKAAQVAPIEVIVQVNKFSAESGMKDILKGFHTTAAADHWLDTK